MLHRYDAVLSALNAGVVIHAADTEILEANGRARDLLGLQDLEGRLATDPQWVFLESSGSPMPLARFPVMQVISSLAPVRDLTMIVRPPSGAEIWIEVNAVPIVDESGTLQQVVVTFIDITERKIATDELQMLANHDPLTGLANRAALMDEISRALSSGHRSGRSVAVLMMDLDRFKSVNDTLGHAAGDALLIAAAARLVQVGRAGDLVARLGGDEFVVVLRDLEDATEAIRTAGRLVHEFHAPFTIEGRELFATASVGVAIDTEGTRGDDLLREADTAMYAAKAAGRDRVSMFNEELRTAVTARLAIESGLRHALERDQLAVWYQPEVDLATGSVIAAEALLRWHHPDGSVWTADRFIDIAEETGTILGIGEWVMRQACRQGAAWAAVSPAHPLTIRVNVSALQLAEAGLLQSVDEALAASDFNPQLLCVEITESALLPRTTTVKANVTGLHDRGIRLAIDDFGTKYASLAYLSKYPFDALKIDRSFITDLGGPNHDHRIVAGIVALSQLLGITAIAEGVEMEEQAARLRAIGCTSAQGWLYSKAVPPEGLAKLLDHRFSVS